MSIRSVESGDSKTFSGANTSVATPTQPIIGTASVIDSTSASVPFTLNTLGATVNSYTVTSNPGSLTATGNTSPLTVSGLTGATSYNLLCMQQVT
jgi:hypothetical protein